MGQQAFMQPQMFFPGQQPAYLPGRGMPVGAPPNFPGAQPGMPGALGRGGALGGMPQGRGGPGQQIPPAALYGMMPNMPPGAFPGAPYNPAYVQQLQAAQQAMGGRGAGPRGPAGMMPGMYNQPISVGGPGMRGGYAGPPPQGGSAGRGGRPGPGQAAGMPGAGPRAGAGPSGPGAGSGELSMQQLNSVGQQQQKQMLGEALYPRVHAQNPELAGKITGMLLEMDNAELLNLIEDEGALRNKVQEAISVYDDYIKSKGKDDEAPKEDEAKTDEVKP